jgi:tetratricopeptide (TPR) repeat protein
MNGAQKLFSLISFVVAVVFLPANELISCSMVKVTRDGITIVGNNEDQMNPNTRIWFETGGRGSYGAVYVGFDNLYPQGGMNAKGLVFDGFGQSFRTVAISASKKKLNALDLEKKIMRECATVGEVKRMLEQYNLDFFSDSSLLFVDKTGRYLFASGDEIIAGEEPSFVQTNRRPGEKKVCWRFDKASAALANSAAATLDNCRAIMETVHQEREKTRVDTLYTTIYDPSRLTIHLYYFYNFKEEVVFDLEHELKKGDRVLNIPDLFHDNEPGRIYYTEYNRVLAMIRNLGAPEMKDREKGAVELIRAVDDSFIWTGAFTYKIYHMAQFFLNEKIDYARAILLLKTNVALMPKNDKTYADLAKAYFLDKQFDLALQNYSQAVTLNPANTMAAEQVVVLMQLLAGNEKTPVSQK